MQIPDITIIGGGYIGCVAALSLAQRDITCTIIEQKKTHAANPSPPSPDASADDRHFGLTCGSCEILTRLGLWKSLAADITPIHSLSIRNRAKHEMLRLDQHDSDDTAHNAAVVGRMIPAHLLQSQLHIAILDHPLINAHFTTSIDDISRTENSGSWRITDSNGKRVNTDLLVAADGAASVTRQRLGIATRQQDYGQWAHQWRISHSLPHQQQGFEYLLETGPYVVLPYRETRQSKLIWCHPDADAQHLAEGIARHYPEELGNIDSIETHGSYPLHLIRAEQGFTEGAVLIGDAYMRVHPVGAQGLNLGIRDAWQLAAHIQHDLQLGLRIGATDRLAQYQKSRHWDRWLVVQLTDFLGRRAGKLPTPDWMNRLLAPALHNPLSKHLIRRVFHGK